MANLHVLASKLETIEVLHGLLGILGLHVGDEAIALGPVSLLVLLQLNGLYSAEGFKYSSHHLLADVAVKVAHIELHGSLLWPDHGVCVVANPVLLSLTWLH